MGLIAKLSLNAVASFVIAVTAEASLRADSTSIDYEFGRPVRKDEMTYVQYRQKHADEAASKYGLKAEEIAEGMDTWHWWVGVDNPGFWRDMAKLTGSKYNYTFVHLDLLRILNSVPRSERFKRLGMINDPDCVAANKPDQYGLMIDRMKDGTLQWDPEVFGYSSGVVGLQLFKNPKFDQSKWSLTKYLNDPASTEPPYLPGMACGFCHVGFNPTNPPANPAEPTWHNLASAIGNQYLHEGLVFSQNLDSHSFIYQYLSTQEPGTSETSRFPMDFINNPTNINSIFRLTDRLKERHVESITPAQRDLIKAMYKSAGVPENSIVGSLGGTEDKPTFSVPHVLTDGADSMGVVMASVRVYLNEGMMHEQWYSSWPIDPFHLLDSFKRGFKPKEFDIATARKDPQSPWMQTERRMPNMATFLMSYDSYPLPKEYLPKDDKLVHRGKIVFADHCASCHSSKRPQDLSGDDNHKKEAWRALVSEEDFLTNNYLSDDERHSVNEIGTNAQRAEGSNAAAGGPWGQMSSQTYKDLRSSEIELVDHDTSGKPVPLYNPVTRQRDIHWKGPAGYYRTPTLVNIWATAPFLHNNSVGTYSSDPSVKGRLAVYRDSMEKLLYPERRLGIDSIKVTSDETSLPEIFPGLKSQLKGLEDLDLKVVMLPKGTPVNLVMNLNPKSILPLMEAYMADILDGKPRAQFKSLINRRRDAGIKAMIAKMVSVSTCPDFIEDRGHTFGADLSDEDKQALMAYALYF